MTTTELTTKQRVELPMNADDLRALFGRANDGDESVLPQVRELLKLDPQNIIAKLHGNLAANNEEMLIRVQANGNDGNTIQVNDGSLLSVYSYRGKDRKTYVEAMRWRLPKQQKGTS